MKLLSQQLWESPDLSHGAYCVYIVKIPYNGFNSGYDINLGVRRTSLEVEIHLNGNPPSSHVSDKKK